MFCNCISLASIDLSNFNTPQLNDMGSLFYNCHSLKYINITSLDTSSVNNMSFMFSNCSSLVSLDLTRFNTRNVNNMEYIFYNCSSLIYLNLYSFYTININEMNNMFDYCHESLIYCIKIDDTHNSILEQLSSYVNNCSDPCFLSSHKKLIDQRKCVENCDYQNYIYEYNEICYESCPFGTIISPSNPNKCEELVCDNYYNYNYIGCIDSIPEGYYCNNTIRKTIDKCIDKCKKCTKESILNNLCISCNNENKYYSKYNEYYNNTNYTDCYNIEPIGYYLDNISNIYKPCFTGINNEKCEECYINNINNSLNYLNCFKKCNYNYEKCIPIYIDTTIKEIETDIMSTNKGIVADIISTYKEIEANIISHNIEKEIDIISANKEIETSIIDDSFNQNNYSYENNSDINGLNILFNNSNLIKISPEIEAALIKEFNLDAEKDKIYLYIFYYINNNTNFVTSDYISKLFLENGTELNISKIEGKYYIDVNVPLINLESSNFNYSKYFARQGYDIYDKNSNFYNDICSPAYINNSDITLKDRKADIYPSNVTICKDNCHYDGINREEQMIKCKCNLKENYNDESNSDNFMEKEDDGNFISYFLDKVNYKIFKCYKLLKNFDNLKKNYAFYIILSITFIIIIFNIIIYRNEISKLKKMVSSGKILSKTQKTRSKSKNLTSKKIINENKSLTSKKARNNSKSLTSRNINNKSESLTVKNIKNKRKSLTNKNVRNKSKSFTCKEAKKKNNIINNPPKKPKIFKEEKNENRNKKRKSKTLKYQKSSTRISFINSDRNHITNYPKKLKKEEKEENEDLNELPYKLAINKDKRNVFKMFISIIIQKLELVNIFLGEEKMKIILACQYILSLLINFFLMHYYIQMKLYQINIIITDN